MDSKRIHTEKPKMLRQVYYINLSGKTESLVYNVKEENETLKKIRAKGFTIRKFRNIIDIETI